MQNYKRKYPIFTYVCLLLCVFTLGTGVTFARYATSQTGGGSAGIAYFVSDFSVQSVSATTFVNTDFWSSSGDDKEALNTPQSIQFVASNHKDGKVSQVDLQSSFRFTASQQFLKDCAFQLVSRDGGEHGVTPQYLMAEILSVAEGLGDGNTITLDTATFVDYGEIAGCNDQTLTISKMSANNVEHIRCVATLDDGNTVTVDISYQQEESNIAYGYSRGEAYSVIAGDYYYNDLVGSILYATVTQQEKIFTVEITLPELFLPANKATSVELFFYLTTTAKHTVEETYQYPDKFFDAVNSGSTLKNIYYDIANVVASTQTGSSMTIPVRLTTTADSMSYVITANDGNPTYAFDIVSPAYTYQAIVGTKLYDITNIATSGNTTSGTFTYGGNTYTVEISTEHTHPLYNAKEGSQNLILGELMNTVYNFNAQVLFVQASELGISSGGANE